MDLASGIERHPRGVAISTGGMVMAWEGTSDRRERLPHDWPIRRPRVLRGASYRCQVQTDGIPCGEPANEVDHIVHGDDHSPENLQAICRWHHGRKTAAEGAAARKPRPTGRREPERHPGLL
jgi:5-methylcytosine-specific restriction endonuclease McrA